MCRWFAYISPSEPCLLEDVLIAPKHSLAKQVHEHYLPKLFAHNIDSSKHPNDFQEVLTRNWFYNIDGIGVVWYSSTRSEFVSPEDPLYASYPVAYKSLLHPMYDPTFLSISANTCTTTCFGHIRSATPTPLRPVPMLSQFNCHPFCYGKYAFMHNGVVSDFDSMRREMTALTGPEQARWVQGNTDSEALAAVFFTYLEEEMKLGRKGGNSGTQNLTILKESMIRTIRAILDTQKRVGGRQQGVDLEPSDLNVAVTDGRVLICSRFRNHRTEQPPSLYYSTTAGVTLNRKFPGHPNEDIAASVNDRNRRPVEHHGAHVIVASEPTTYKSEEWKLIEKNTCILVDEDGSVRMQPLEIEFDDM